LILSIAWSWMPGADGAGAQYVNATLPLAGDRTARQAAE
jgi:hypothetical protein